METTIAPVELKAAFKRSCIWRLGWTFERAMSVPSIATSIRMSAIAHRRKHQGTDAPAQAQLNLQEAA